MNPDDFIFNFDEINYSFEDLGVSAETLSSVFTRVFFSNESRQYWYTPGDKPDDGPDAERIRKAAKWKKGLEPRDGYIDAGIILAEGITISKAQFEEADAKEWNWFSNWVDSVPNLVAEELLKDQVYWIYSYIPCTTTMEK